MIRTVFLFIFLENDTDTYVVSKTSFANFSGGSLDKNEIAFLQARPLGTSWVTCHGSYIENVLLLISFKRLAKTLATLTRQALNPQSRSQACLLASLCIDRSYTDPGILLADCVNR